MRATKVSSLTSCLVSFCLFVRTTTSVGTSFPISENSCLGAKPPLATSHPVQLSAPSLHHTPNGCTTDAKMTSLQDLSHTFRTLRSAPSHFEDAEAAAAHDTAAVDTFNGEKHKVMNALQEALMKEKPLPTDKLVAVLGMPDHITTDAKVTKGDVSGAGGLNFMPGPAIPSADGSAASTTAQKEEDQFFVYKWRGYHDYLWFRVQGGTGDVIDSGWYKALE